MAGVRAWEGLKELSNWPDFSFTTIVIRKKVNFEDMSELE